MALTKTNLANIVEGTLPVANGGTGSTSLSGANLAVTNATNTFTVDQSISGLTVGKGGGAVATNTAVGYQALLTDTSGLNTALGYQAAKTVNGGGTVTAVGYLAGTAVTTGDLTAFGYQAGKACTTPNFNVAVGNNALSTNSTGANNTAIGAQSLLSNTTASNNTAVGYQAGYANTVATHNTFLGYQAGVQYNGSGGTYNTFLGAQAGYAQTSGQYNTYVGLQAGYYITTGTKNTIIGAYTGNQGGLDIRTASNYIVLSDGDGNPRGYFDGSGNMYVLGIYNNPTSGGGNVRVQSNGLLQRDTSSLKYKNSIENATHGLNKVLALRPVTYKSNTDGDKVFGGLIAEEVDAAGLTEFVQYAEDGSPDALSYGNMVSLAFKAIQELKAEFDAYKAKHP